MSWLRSRLSLVLALAALTLVSAIVGCGSGRTISTSTQPARHALAQAAPCTNVWSPACPDREPVHRFAQSLGALPGTSGENGRLTRGVTTIAGGHLGTTAAASWNTMNLEVYRQWRVIILPGDDVDATYRTFARQVYWQDYWCGQGLCGNAATPGYSNHGWARAVDLPNCDNSRTTLDRFGGPVTWRWGETNECWHVTYYGPFGRPNPGTDASAPLLCQGSGGYGQQPWVPVLVKRLRNHGQLATNQSTVTAKTAGNLRNFQASRRLKPTGCTDHSTWAALKRP